MLMVPAYLRAPPAYFHSRILVGPGAFLTQRFVAERDITHVINCAFDGDSPHWWRAYNPTRYTCIAAVDSAQVEILWWYEKFETAMRRYLRQGSGIVYVHCQAGMNRSAYLALLYIAKNFNMSIDTMVPLLLKQRPCMFQNAIFMNQVKEFINGRLPSEKGPGITIGDDDIGDA